MASPEESMFMQLVGGTTHLEVQVGGNRIILDEQIAGPQRDQLIGRSTTVHLDSKRHGPYAIRPNEGEVLESLQGVSGVVRLPTGMRCSKTEKDLDTDHIDRDFKLVTISSTPPLGTLHQMEPNNYIVNQILNSKYDRRFKPQLLCYLLIGKEITQARNRFIFSQIAKPLMIVITLNPPQMAVMSFHVGFSIFSSKTLEVKASVRMNTQVQLEAGAFFIMITEEDIRCFLFCFYHNYRLRQTRR